MREKGHLAVEILAMQLVEDGYTVFMTPDSSQIPFDLKDYHPDMIAKKGGENLIIEVKTRSTPRTIERYKEIAEIIGQQDGWRFILSTIDERYQVKTPVIKSELAPEVIQRAIQKLDSLFDSDNFDLALPYLWDLYISGMRTVGQSDGVPIDLTTDRSVLNTMYSLGEISNEEYETSKAFLDLRNRIIQTFDVKVARDEAHELQQFVKQMLVNWQLMPL